MTETANTRNGLPDLDRTDVDTVRVSDGATDVDGVFAALARGPWPEGLVSFNAYENLDDRSVVTYAQWTGTGTDLTGQDEVEYRMYRSGTRENPPTPGCVVLVRVEFDGPDEQRQRQWVDTVFDALGAESTPNPDGISAHFHVSTDGTRVFNYAEWTSAQAHRETLARSGQGTVGTSPLWQRVKEFPGVRAHGFQRYQLVRGVSRV